MPVRLIITEHAQNLLMFDDIYNGKKLPPHSNFIFHSEMFLWLMVHLLHTPVSFPCHLLLSLNQEKNIKVHISYIYYKVGDQNALKRAPRLEKKKLKEEARIPINSVPHTTT